MTLIYFTTLLKMCINIRKRRTRKKIKSEIILSFEGTKKLLLVSLIGSKRKKKKKEMNKKLFHYSCTRPTNHDIFCLKIVPFFLTIFLTMYLISAIDCTLIWDANYLYWRSLALMIIIVCYISRGNEIHS